jgi:hypothetical protein
MSAGIKFKITEDGLTPFLRYLTSEDFKNAKKNALFRGSSVMSSAAVKAFAKEHPPRAQPTVRKRRKVSTKMKAKVAAIGYAFFEDETFEMNFLGSGIVGARGRKGAGRLVRRQFLGDEGESLLWQPRYLLDWFESGTEDRTTQGWQTLGKGRTTVLRRRRKSTKMSVTKKWMNIRVGKGGFRGRIKGSAFIMGAIGSVQQKITDNMGRYLNQALTRILRKKSNQFK